jgi:hypothetical protein
VGPERVDDLLNFWRRPGKSAIQKNPRNASIRGRLCVKFAGFVIK